MESTRVDIRICGGCGYGGKESQVREALSRSGLGLSPSNVTIQRGEGRTLVVTMTKAGKTSTLINKSGPGYYGPGTPQEIVEAIRNAH